MPRGGKREGAGRKMGARNTRTQEIAVQATAAGITPLEVMLGAMRQSWEANDKDAAARFAKDAAPYVHPRLAAVEHTGKDGKDLIPEHPPTDVARAVLDLLGDAHRSAAAVKANGHDSS